MRVAIGADHGGYPMKAEVAQIVGSLGHEVTDLGAHELDPADDYPDLAAPVAKAVQNGEAGPRHHHLRQRCGRGSGG